MINKEGLLEYLKRKGVNSSIVEIEQLINKEDRKSIEEIQNKRIRYEIWDKKSNINGVGAKEIINSRKYPIGQAYLIYIDDALVYFQDHDPNKLGYEKMTKSQAEKTAKEFVQYKIEEYVDNIIVDRVLQTLLSK